mmetsp:Transcript_42545/g.105897  ORF Transcript_42545/g.105897 Transcript_42545/m.105897 type:complete len:208 (+) Transcript_42545:442-1065(+)
MEPSTECDSRPIAAAFCSAEWMPAPARQTRRCPSSIGMIASSLAMLITTVGRSLPFSAPRGTDPPVSPVFAPCGSTATSASTHACTHSTHCCSVPGRTTANATPRPRREPCCSTADWTCAAPTMASSCGRSASCAFVSRTPSQQARQPEGSIRVDCASSLRRRAYPAENAPPVHAAKPKERSIGLESSRCTRDAIGVRGAGDGARRG